MIVAPVDDSSVIVLFLLLLLLCAFKKNDVDGISIGITFCLAVALRFDDSFLAFAMVSNKRVLI